MRCSNFEAISIDALPQRVNLSLFIGVEMKALIKEIDNLQKPLSRLFTSWCDKDNVIHIPGVVFNSEIADAELIDFIKINICEVLRTHIPERYSALSLGA